LDARIQTIIEQALRHPVLGRAAAVVVDPNNGDILGMGSIPSFDPNVFIPSISEPDWKKLNDDEAVPLINRAVRGFPPGSTFKIVTAMAGLPKNMEKSRWNCPGGVQYGDHYFKCWISEKHGTHGTLGLSDAIKVSCDSFFYQYGNAAGIENIVRIGKLLGLGEAHNLGLLDEVSGDIPGPEWMKVNHPNERWTSAQTANTSIGQGYVLASPLQMAMSYAAVANGGIAYEPRLVRTVLTPEGQPFRDENGQVAVPDQPKIRGDLRNEMTKEQIEVVRHGLWAVINESGGTGAKARLKNIVVAGKTGTAQASDRGKKEHIAWFCCFAPFEHPRYAICTMVENGEHGGGVAAPIAARILEQCLAMDQGSLAIDVASFAPARNPNPFTVIEALPDYNNANAIKLAVEEETAGEKESNAKIDMGPASARPDIRPSADPAGKVPPRTGAPKPKSDRRNFFEKVFGLGRKPAGPAPAPDKRTPLSPFRPGGR
jgi:penicillin-binding protein 2